MTQTMTLTSEITAILAEDGWRPRWAACTNAMTDEYGNTVAIHEQGETVPHRVRRYALPGGVMETMDLDPSHGARRIALAILALATPEE